MKFDQIPHDRQAETKPAVAAASLRLPERLKQMRQIVGADSLPGIGNREMKTVIRVRKRDADGAALRRKLQRVGQEIPDNLLEALRIQNCHPPLVGYATIKSYAFGAGHWLQRLESRTERFPYVYWREIQFQLCCADSKNIQKLFDELKLNAHVALNNLRSLSYGFFVRLTSKDARPTQNRSQGSAKIMRKNG